MAPWAPTPGSSSQLGVRQDTDTDDDQVRGHRLPAGRPERLDPVAADEGIYRSRQTQYYPLLRVLCLVEVRYHGRYHAAHHPVLHLEHGDRVTELARDCRDLEADVTCPDDDDVACILHFCTNSIDIVDAAQIVDTGEIAAGDFESPGT